MLAIDRRRLLVADAKDLVLRQRGVVGVPVIERKSDPNGGQPSSTRALALSLRQKSEKVARGRQEAAEAFLDRNEQPQWPHEIGGQPQPTRALVERLAHERKIAVLQIAQAAVNEPRRICGRARGKIAAIDHDDILAVER